MCIIYVSGWVSELGFCLHTRRHDLYDTGGGQALRFTCQIIIIRLTLI